MEWNEIKTEMKEWMHEWNEWKMNGPKKWQVSVPLRIQENMKKSESAQTMFGQSFDETFFEFPFLDFFNWNEHQGRWFVGL